METNHTPEQIEIALLKAELKKHKDFIDKLEQEMCRDDKKAADDALAYLNKIDELKQELQIQESNGIERNVITTNLLDSIETLKGLLKDALIYGYEIGVMQNKVINRNNVSEYLNDLLK